MRQKFEHSFNSYSEAQEFIKYLGFIEWKDILPIIHPNLNVSALLHIKVARNGIDTDYAVLWSDNSVMLMYHIVEETRN